MSRADQRARDGRRRRLAVLLMTTLALLLAAVPGTARAVDPVPTVRQLTGSGAWTWFQGPRAVARADATYVGSVSKLGHVRLSRYEHPTGAIQTVDVSTHVFGWDDHSAPALVGTRTGLLAVFYSGHNTTDLRYKFSGRGWGLRFAGPEHHLVGSGLERETTDTTRSLACYPTVLWVPGERRYYAFLRFGVRHDLYYTTSTDLLRWTHYVRILRNDVYDLAPDHPVPYTKIALAPDGVTLHLATTASNPRAFVPSGLYHFRLRRGIVSRDDGTVLRTPTQLALRSLVPAEGTLVKADDEGGVRLYDVTVDERGRPVIVYTADQRYGRAVLTDAGWQRSWVTDKLGTYPQGITLAVGSSTRLWLVDGASRLLRYDTADDGATWRRTVVSATGPNRAPVSVRGTSPVDVVWMHGAYRGVRDFDTSLRLHLDPAALG